MPLVSEKDAHMFAVDHFVRAVWGELDIRSSDPVFRLEITRSLSGRRRAACEKNRQKKRTLLFDAPHYQSTFQPDAR